MASSGLQTKHRETHSTSWLNDPKATGQVASLLEVAQQCRRPDSRSTARIYIHWYRARMLDQAGGQVRPQYLAMMLMGWCHFRAVSLCYSDHSALSNASTAIENRPGRPAGTFFRTRQSSSPVLVSARDIPHAWQREATPSMQRYAEIAQPSMHSRRPLLTCRPQERCKCARCMDRMRGRRERLPPQRAGTGGARRYDELMSR